MVLLRHLGVVVLLISLTVFAQAEEVLQTQHISDQDLAKLVPSITRSLDFLNWQTTTPKPQRPAPTKDTRPTNRPPKEDRPTHHYPFPYPYYPSYPYSPPQHYWPGRPEDSDNHGHVKPVYPTHPHTPAQQYPHHSYYPHYNHYPQLPPYGYPSQHPPFYSPSGYPYYVVHNPSGPNPYPHGPPLVKPPVRPEHHVDITELNNQTEDENNDNTQNIEEINEEVDDEEETPRSISTDSFNISSDSTETHDADTITTKDVKLPIDFLLSQQRSRKRISDQVALVYLRNLKKGRQLRA